MNSNIIFLDSILRCCLKEIKFIYRDSVYVLKR